MRDYVREMMKVWEADGDQRAYDLTAKLLEDIKDESDRLKRQAGAITAFELYLLDSGNIKERTAREGWDKVKPSERPREITTAAFLCLGRRSGTVTVDEVFTALSNQGLDLGVQQPHAVIGTVLAKAEGFTKVARNKFEYENLDDLSL